MEAGHENCFGKVDWGTRGCVGGGQTDRIVSCVFFICDIFSRYNFQRWSCSSVEQVETHLYHSLAVGGKVQKKEKSLSGKVFPTKKNAGCSGWLRVGLLLDIVVGQGRETRRRRRRMMTKLAFMRRNLSLLLKLKLQFDLFFSSFPFFLELCEEAEVGEEEDDDEMSARLEP